MFHRHAPIVLVITGFLTAAAASATTQLKVDLATDPGTEQVGQVAPGDYTVLIVDKAPKKAYGVQVEVNFTPVPPLTPPAGGAAPRIDDPCLQLTNDTSEIRNSEDEKRIAVLVAEIGQVLQSGTCKDHQKTQDALSAVDLTRQPVDDIVYTLAGGQELKVTVSRDSGSNEKKWTFIFRTPSPGRWFSSYGFVFVPNRDERYFSKLKPGTTDRYLITRAGDNSGSDFSPSLFFSWLPASRETKALSLGASAGLGFDQSNPIVFVGPMLTYHQNVSLVVGLVVHKQKRLNGMYSRGEEIGENLTEPQLTEQTYKPNVFFGLSFRFGSNPFATSGSDSKAPAQTPQQKKPETPK
jgi:hypothetical protein